MRKKIVAGNWKMHGSRQQVSELAEGIRNEAGSFPQVEIVVLPSFVFIPDVAKILQNSHVRWGAQDLYMGRSGAFTGEVSGPMLTDYGCLYVLVGHSERRHIFHEDLDLIAAKFKAAIDARIIPILCVGETQQQREAGQTEAIIKQQLASVIESASIVDFHHAVIAYEPVWAIGTGLTASPEQAQEVHGFIRKQIANYDIDVAKGLRILYGGSVKPDNAKGLFAKPDIDGGLIGGASLQVESFLGICAGCKSDTFVE